ncbi:hypothetical protein B2G50_19170 [Leptospira interrogans serovar Canicola]|nr:hypothetical protein B2G50_19170 [Leptospira interrogans serovar Canicola]
MYARILLKRFPQLLTKNHLCDDPKYFKMSDDSSVIPKKDSIMSFQITQTYKELMNNIRYTNNIARMR